MLEHLLRAAVWLVLLAAVAGEILAADLIR